MAIRIAVTATSVILLASACGSAEEEASVDASAAESSSTECVEVSPEMGAAIAEGGVGIEWVRGQAVKSPDHEGVYYVAGVVDDGQGEVAGVWGTPSLEPWGGVVLAVDGFAQEFTDWPRSTDRTGSMSVSDDGAVQAKGCLS